MKTLCKFRLRVDIYTTVFDYTVVGKWHYRYLDEEIIEERKTESVNEITSFHEARVKADKYWPYVSIGSKLFSGKPFMRITDYDGFNYHDVLEREFIKAVQCSEYEIVNAADVGILTLANHLPADEFVDFVRSSQ